MDLDKAVKEAILEIDSMTTEEFKDSLIEAGFELEEYIKVENFTLQDAYSLCEPVHFEWYSKELTVIFDGYTEEGVRVHVVEGVDHLEPVMISNAIVISSGECLCN